MKIEHVTKDGRETILDSDEENCSLIVSFNQHMKEKSFVLIGTKSGIIVNKLGTRIKGVSAKMMDPYQMLLNVE